MKVSSSTCLPLLLVSQCLKITNHRESPKREITFLKDNHKLPKKKKKKIKLTDMQMNGKVKITLKCESKSRTR